MPYLTRTSQKLLLWRDKHADINAIPKMDRVIAEYKPTKIVLEMPMNGAHLERFTWRSRKFSSSLMP